MTPNTIQQTNNNEIQYKNNFSYGFGIFSGVLAGIIAGVFINIILQKIIENRRKSKIIRQIEYEINYNIEHVEKIISKLKDMISASGTKNTPLEYRPLNINHKINSSLTIAYRNGILYEIMPKENIADIIKFLDGFSSVSANIYNQLLLRALDNDNPEETVKELINIKNDMEKYHKNLKSSLQSMKK